MPGWSQRRRRGGGGAPAPTATTVITRILIGDVNDGTIVVYFSRVVAVASFAAGNFTNNTVGGVGTAIAQSEADSLVVGRASWEDVEAIGDSITYAGTAPGVLTPQTVAITAH
jgi:hypothetical protein